MDKRMKPGRKRKHGDSNDGRESIFNDAPRDIKIVEFAESRAAEIEALSKCCETTGGAKRVFQTLPRHMRRRAMSHNIKRLPRRMRDIASKESEKHQHETKKASSKRPSRRHRRRPKNLLSEYNRRKRKHVWLETHIWHAKRFKMAEKWGYKIPVHPNDKSSRAAYRAADKHCLLQDMSYMCCVEVTGPEREILNGLGHITSQKTGRTFAAKFTLDGSRQGYTMIYSCDQYPLNAIGYVNFLWKPVNQSNSTSDINSVDLRQLWIWSHPACYSQVWDELCKTFSATNSKPNPAVRPEHPVVAKHVSVAASASPMTHGEHDKNTVIKPEGATNDDATLTVAQTTPRHQEETESNSKIKDSEDDTINSLSATNGSVTLNLLKDSLVRYRLCGPLSQSVLADLCRKPFVRADNVSTCTNQWWTEYYRSEEGAGTHDEQWEAWEAMKSARSPAELSPHCVLALTLRDPRIFLPPKKTKVMDAPADRTKNNHIPCDPSLCVTSHKMTASPLWQKDVRDVVKSTKISEQEMNRIRSQLLIPGSQMELGDEESRIPVLLIQRPGKQKHLADSRKQTGTVMNNNSMKQTGTKLKSWKQLNTGNQSNVTLGFGSGWDIILPSGWGMAFWISLVYRGARVGGIREAESIAREQGDLHFPLDFPDTAACKEQQELTKASLENKHNRYPPAKRPNFLKLGTEAPFHCPWKELVTEWERLADSNTQILNLICNVAPETDQNMKDGIQSDFYVLRDKDDLRELRTVLQMVDKFSSDAERSSAQVVSHKLTQALVTVNVTMHKRGTPTQFAMICIPEPHDLKALQENTDFGGPTEPMHKDDSEKITSKFKNRKKRQKESTTLETFTTENTKKFQVLDLLHSTSRQIIGFVNHGAFSLAQGFGSGLGFCSAIGLLRLATLSNHGSLQVLVRSANSLQYRFASLTLRD